MSDVCPYLIVFYYIFIDHSLQDEKKANEALEEEEDDGMLCLQIYN